MIAHPFKLRHTYVFVRITACAEGRKSEQFSNDYTDAFTVYMENRATNFRVLH